MFHISGHEIDRYIGSSFDCDDVTPLEFWKSHSKRFPQLSEVARSVYAIPASQNKSERAFSAASHVMTDLRTTLDPEHLDELLLLRSQFKVNQSN
jgi:hAT family C-terminal dimerisation region